MPVIASFNVNSIRARLDGFLEWLDRLKPDIVLLQEIKCMAEDFPFDVFQHRGYQPLIKGQKSYNGVAILSREPAILVCDSLPFGEGEVDLQARFIEAKIEGMNIISLYVPNGNPIKIDSGNADNSEISEKFLYKLNWMKHLNRYIKAKLEMDEKMILGGDFNICRQELDMYDREKFIDDALFHLESRRLFHTLLGFGMVDAWRTLHPNQRGYTYWDLWKSRWQKDEGVRIDYFLLSPAAADGLRDCYVDKTPRGGEKPSDHTPLIMEYA